MRKLFDSYKIDKKYFIILITSSVNNFYTIVNNRSSSIIRIFYFHYIIRNKRPYLIKSISYKIFFLNRSVSFPLLFSFYLFFSFVSFFFLFFETCTQFGYQVLPMDILSLEARKRPKDAVTAEKECWTKEERTNGQYSKVLVRVSEKLFYIQGATPFRPFVFASTLHLR